MLNPIFGRSAMKQKLFAVLALFLTLSLVMTVKASYGLSDGIDGYVYGNGLPAVGITVRVYNAADALEGYGVNDDNSPGALGTDVTDVNGYFHIAWLYAHSGTYKVVAETPVGNLIQYVTVNCGATTSVCFSYSCGGEPNTPGYWKNHPEAWPIESVTIGGITYTKAQAIELLDGANAKDATYKLASHLIAAKLNVASGVSAPTSVINAITEADTFLSTHPLGSDPQGADRDYALALKDILDAFNNS